MNERPVGALRRLLTAAREPVDAAGLAAFRVLFGLLCTVSAVRFVARGWVESIYLQPEFHFRYAGFSWIPEPSEAGLYALFGAMALAGLGIASGVLYRLSAAVWLGAFVWVELLEEATYLNHYYLMTLLGVLVLALPLHRGPRLPAWMGWLLRGQIAIVYVFAGLAKLTPDWLAGEPLHTWLRPMGDIPVLGPLLVLPGTAVAMAWAGTLYDLSIPLLLSARRTRALGFAAVVAFHVATWLLFPIGVFPWLMIAASTLFFAPSWPRRLLGARWDRVAWRGAAPGPRPPLGPALAAGWLLLQVVLPLRHLGLPGDVAWTGRGFRFSWRVMLVEKTGLVEFRLVDRASGATRRVSPRADLTPQQYKMLCTEQELIAEYARHLAAEERAAGRDVAVYADALISLNGRPRARAVDPSVDLSVPAHALPDHWIPAPYSEP